MIDTARQTQGEVHVAIPVKNIANAKQRLAGVLSPEQRRNLFAAMVADVLEAVVAALGPHRVWLVTGDDEVMAMADEVGVSVLLESHNQGHTSAVKFAAQSLKGKGIDSMLTLPGDVPLVTADELCRVIDAHQPGPSVTISPARDELGSNAVLCTPPDVLDFRFGEDSFFPHLDKARASGIEPTIVPQPGLGLDIDEPEDLALFAGQHSATRAYRYLEAAGILDRYFSGS